MASPKVSKDNYDFSGYATKAGVLCSDGRTIVRDAFKECNGKIVPLVWAHLHNEPKNVLGHALLENRDDGVYTYALFNPTVDGQTAKLLVSHNDILNLSIYANELVEKSKSVLHGNIREVSLVMAGANPGAVIEYVSFAHEDGGTDVSDDSAVIFTNEIISLPESTHEDTKPVTEKPEPVLEHVDVTKSTDEETIQEIFDGLTPKQKDVVYYMVGQAVEAATSKVESADATHSDINEEKGDGKIMKHNAFDGKDETVVMRPTMTREQFNTLFADAEKFGSLKKSFIAHAQDYGIENIDYLFPDARTVGTMSIVQRQMEWVTALLNGCVHSPFSRIKSLTADITAAKARALGYIKGNLKVEEVIRVLRRLTTPTTIYKKQKLDRDDILDITDVDIVAFVKAEMRVMLNEEVARAVLVGDGRDPVAELDDKIDETKIRPVWTDDDLYAYHIRLTADQDAEDSIEAVIRARAHYTGSGNPSMYTTTDFVSDMLLLKDLTGRRIYPTLAELATALRVKDIIEVPVMDTLQRQSSDETPVTLDLLAIIFNPRDYTLGADKGGEVNFFDDFDIDYNQQKYLLETRLSGALTIPGAALVIEQVYEA